MNAYFFKMNKDEKNDILDQHKKLYDGYVTRYNQESNETPLYTQDYANDKGGITVNNKGEVKTYTNMGINESMLDTIGDGPNDLENGTVDLESNSDHEMMHDTYPSPNEDEFDFISLGLMGNDGPDDDEFDGYEEDMTQNLDQYEYDIDELEDYSTDDLYEMYQESDEVNIEEEDGDDLSNDDNFELGGLDEDDIPDVMSSINESMDMFRRFNKYN